MPLTNPLNNNSSWMHPMLHGEYELRIGTNCFGAETLLAKMIACTMLAYEAELRGFRFSKHMYTFMKSDRKTLPFKERTLRSLKKCYCSHV